MSRNRSRSYYRAQRRRAINHKKFIYLHIYRADTLWCSPGFLAKNKVHCSCCMCKYEKCLKILQPKYKSRLQEMKKEIDEVR